MKFFFNVTILFIFSTCCSIIATNKHPLGLNKNMPYGIISDKYQTPHVKWATPFAKGKIKALVMAPCWSQRETVELAQRLSLDYSAWMPIGFNCLSASSSDAAAAFYLPPPPLVIKTLTEFLKKDYDVIIIGKLDWEMIPGNLRFKIFEKVSKGTGLIYVNPPTDNKELKIVLNKKEIPEGKKYITGNLPLKHLPAFEKITLNKLLRTSKFGKGRVVTINYLERSCRKPKYNRTPALPCLTPLWDDNDPKKQGYVPSNELPEIQLVPYEYYQALIAKAVIWAGKKTCKSAVSIKVAEKFDYPLSGVKIPVKITTSPANATVKAVLRSRYDYKTVCKLNVKNGMISMPDVMAGKYILDCWLLDSKHNRILDWISKYLEVKADIFVSEVKTDKNMYNGNDTISGKVKLSRQLKTGEILKVSLYDNFDRQTDVTIFKSGTQAAFKLKPVEFLSIMNRIEAVVYKNNKPLCKESFLFPVRRKNSGDNFYFILWTGTQNQYITYAMLDKLKKHDSASAIDICWAGATEARNIAMTNLLAVPYTKRWGVISGKKIAKRCMESMIDGSKLRNWVDRVGSIYAPYGPLCWTHGDESRYEHDKGNQDLCWCPNCLKKFRQALPKYYKNVAKLNKKWGTSYKSFSEAMPLTFEDASKQKKYAPWIIHRFTSNQTFCDFFANTGDLLKQYDKGGRTAGFDGIHNITTPNDGMDFPAFKDSMDVVQTYIYDSHALEWIRSFSNKKQITGMWFGTYGLTWTIGPNTVPFCHVFPWYSLFHQMNSAWFWTMGAPGPLSGYAPDLTSLPYFAASVESISKIKGGLDKLLLNSSRLNSGVAIYYSKTSKMMECFYAKKKQDWALAWRVAATDFNKLLEDSGYQYVYLSAKNIIANDLKKGKFKLLMMPHTRALSQKEATAVIDFVKNGGTVISDIMPGWHDGTGKKLSQSLLAKIFPIDKKGHINKYGRGKTILIGDKFYGYAKRRGDRTLKRNKKDDWKQFRKLLTEQVGIKPQMKISSKKYVPPTETMLFQCGQNMFAGLIRDYFLYDNEARKANIHFQLKAHIYDAITGKYLGHSNNINTELSYKAKLYFLCKYKVAGIKINAPASLIAGEKIKIDANLMVNDGAKPSRHVFNVRIYDPAGTELKCYTQNVKAPNGSAGFSIATALNESVGTYTIKIKDAATGVEAEHKYKVTK